MAVVGAHPFHIGRLIMVEPRKYPYVGKGVEGSVVLFTSPHAGKFLIPGLYRYKSLPGEFGYFDEKFFHQVDAVVIKIKDKHYLVTKRKKT
jgi:hypothetical protein